MDAVELRGMRSGMAIGYGVAATTARFMASGMEMDAGAVVVAGPDALRMLAKLLDDFADRAREGKENAV